jgi:PKD repeat protein
MSRVISRSNAPLAQFRPAALFALLMLLALDAVAGSVTLAWDPVTGAPVSGYRLYYGATAGNYTVKIDAGNVTTKSIANLTAGATYHFAVTAYDSSGAESGYSNDVTAKIPSSAPVANFTASVTSGVAPLAMNFTSTSTGSITSYAWKFGDGTTSTSQSPSHVYSAAGSYTVSLTVTGSGGSNTKSAANYINVTTGATPSDSSRPTAPASLTAAATSSTSVKLAWTASTDNVGVTGYRIERCQGAGCTSFVQIATASATSYADSSLAGTTYSYRVRATDAAGNVSPYSNTAAAALGGTTGVNVALAANGGVATASSAVSSSNGASYAIDNRRAGLGWMDGTSGVFPDWVQIAFRAKSTIDRIVVYSVQDNYPVEPTDTMTFTKYGVTAFQVQGWNGSAWVTLASVTGNNLVKRTVILATPYATERIRVVVNGSADHTSSRIAEIEAWTSSATTTSVDVNYALATNGGVASASTIRSSSNGANYVIDNRRAGLGWMDGTEGVFPDWVQIAFRAKSAIDRVVVYSVQDGYPVEPTNTMTFTKYGVTSFRVQGWNGSTWVTLASVTGNNLVKRTVTLAAPYTTDRIRVVVNGTADRTWSRVAEIEAWGR